MTWNLKISDKHFQAADMLSEYQCLVVTSSRIILALTVALNRFDEGFEH
jgi:hypothetical protein